MYFSVCKIPWLEHTRNHGVAQFLFAVHWLPSPDCALGRGSEKRTMQRTMHQCGWAAVQQYCWSPDLWYVWALTLAFDFVKAWPGDKLFYPWESQVWDVKRRHPHGVFITVIFCYLLAMEKRAFLCILVISFFKCPPPYKSAYFFLCFSAAKDGKVRGLEAALLALCNWWISTCCAA